MGNRSLSFLGASSCWLLLAAGCSGPGDAAEGEGPLGSAALPIVETNYTLDEDPDLPNPERGVAYWSTSSTAEAHTLAYHFLWLGPWCAADLDWAGLDQPGTSDVLNTWAHEALEMMVVEGKKVIVRPRYDAPNEPGVVKEGVPNGCGKLEAGTYELMIDHVDAIAAMLGDPQIRPAIGFVEMGYLGSWGEWNVAGTRCGLPPEGEPDPVPGRVVAECRVLAPVLLATAAERDLGRDRIHFAEYVIDTYQSEGAMRPVGMRRPEFHRDAAYNLGVAHTKMGFHNDCFMLNASDGGTFSHLESGYEDYEELYPLSVMSQQQARDYLQKVGGFGTQGGEACNGSGPLAGNEDWRTTSAVPGRLDLERYQYLHGSPSEFREAMIDGVVWDTIRSRLGYRYHVTEVSYPASASANQLITVSVHIDNSGFERIPKDRTAYLVLEGTQKYIVGNSNPKPETYALIVPTMQSNQSVRSWKKGGTTVFSQTFHVPPSAGTHPLHLYIPDPDCTGIDVCPKVTRSKLAVRLATRRFGDPLFQTTTGTNWLGVALTVPGFPHFP